MVKPTCFMLIDNVKLYLCMPLPWNYKYKGCCFNQHRYNVQIKSGWNIECNIQIKVHSSYGSFHACLNTNTPAKLLETSSTPPLLAPSSTPTTRFTLPTFPILLKWSTTLRSTRGCTTTLLILFGSVGDIFTEYVFHRSEI